MGGGTIAGVDAMWVIGGGAVVLLLFVLIIFAVMSSSAQKKKALATKKSAPLGSGKPATKAQPAAEGPSAGAVATAAASNPAVTKRAAPPASREAPLFEPNKLPASPPTTPVSVSEQTPSAAARKPDRILADFSSADSWETPGAGPPPSGLANGAYALDPLSGTLAKGSLPANQGERFVLDYSVQLLAAPKNGKPAAYVAGPLFLDAAGNVLSWGGIEAPLTGKVHEGRVEAVAPAGAVRVQLYLGGMWAPEEPHPDGKLAYTRASLSAL